MVDVRADGIGGPNQGSVVNAAIELTELFDRQRVWDIIDGDF